MPPMRLIQVRSGVAYGDWGQELAPVSSLTPDGLYIDDIKWSLFVRGKWVGDPPTPSKKTKATLDPAWAITQYPRLLTASDENITIGEFPFDVPIGTLVMHGNDEKYGRVYYIPEQSRDELAKAIAKWWVRFPEKTPWISNTDGKKKHTRHVLNPLRMKWVKEIGNPVVTRLVGDDYRDFMSSPTELHEQVAKLVKPTLHKYLKILNAQIAPYGGKITSIKPTWQKHIALIFVEFQINGIDPTWGMGCTVYKNGDFYYGPWCQRPRQKDLAPGIELLHDFPPRYTLAEWITGPLYETAIRSAKGGNYGISSNLTSKEPRMFHPTGVVMLATGTQKTTETAASAPKRSVASVIEAQMLASFSKSAGAAWPVKAVTKKLAGIIKADSVMRTPNGMTISRIPFPQAASFCVGVAYGEARNPVLRTNGLRVRYAVTIFVREGDTLNAHVPPGTSLDFSVEVPGDMKGKWGFDPDLLPRGEKQTPIDRYPSALHWAMPVKGCACAICLKTRGVVHSRIVEWVNSHISELDSLKRAKNSTALPTTNVFVTVGEGNPIKSIPELMMKLGGMSSDEAIRAMEELISEMSAAKVGDIAAQSTTDPKIADWNPFYSDFAMKDVPLPDDDEDDDDD